MALIINCRECGGSYLAPDIPYFPKPGENPYLGRANWGDKNPCTCKEKWDEENAKTVGQDVEGEALELKVGPSLADLLCEALNGLEITESYSVAPSGHYRTIRIRRLEEG